MQIEYDPAQITYEQLLEAFWKNHNPCAPPYSRQYMTAIFAHDDKQKELALKTKEREEAKQKQKIQSQVLPLTEFYLAEDYHQKYYLQQVPDLAKELRSYYPTMKDFVASTAVLRVNAYLDGQGSLAQLEKEIDRLGLSPQGQQKLRAIVKQRQQR